jgi:hypothetical protein
MNPEMRIQAIRFGANIRIQAPPIQVEEPRASSISQVQFIFLASVV